MAKVYGLPVAGGKFSAHFGHADQFALVSVEDNQVTDVKFENAPEHAQGSFPAWLKSVGADAVIASGMGPMAQQNFVNYGIELVLQAQGTDPKAIVEAYVKGILEKGADACDHDSPNHQHGSNCAH